MSDNLREWKVPRRQWIRGVYQFAEWEKMTEPQRRLANFIDHMESLIAEAAERMTDEQFEKAVEETAAIIERARREAH